MKLMSYDEWMKRTYRRGRRRSKEIKALDACLEQYSQKEDPAVLAMIKQHFATWKASKGAMWNHSSRNWDRAITELDNQLTEFKDPRDMENARLGLVYLFGNTKVHNPVCEHLLGAGLGIASKGMSLHSELNPTELSFGESLAGSYHPVSAMEREGALVTTPMIQSGTLATRAHHGETPSFAKIKGWLTDYVRNIADELCNVGRQYRDDPRTLVHSGMVVKATKNFVTLLAQHLFSKIKNQVAPGLDLLKGLVNTTKAIVAKVKAWAKGMGVRLMAGHPAAVCSALGQSMTGDIWSGLYDLIKGATTMAASFLGGVGSAIVGLVIAALEAVTQFVYRYTRAKKLEGFFSTAADHWNEYRDRAARAGSLHQKTGSASLGPGRQDAGGRWESDLKSFHAWLRQNFIEMPELAALAMHSGICGDKMRFLDMMTYDLRSVALDQSLLRFKGDVEYLDYLKSYSGSVVAGSPFKFYSTKPDVNTYINHSKKFIDDSDMMKQNNRIGLLGYVDKFANA